MVVVQTNRSEVLALLIVQHTRRAFSAFFLSTSLLEPDSGSKNVHHVDIDGDTTTNKYIIITELPDNAANYVSKSQR